MVKQKIREIIEMPQDIKIEIEGNIVKMSKGDDEVKRKLDYAVRKEDNKLIIGIEKGSKKDRKMARTIAAHIRNMISGLEEKYVYKLQICSVHFPMSVSVSEKSLVIKNFLGETKERKAKILPGVDVKIEGDIIIVKSSDKEKAGQTAANIERATKIKKRDRRIFQDGIYIIEKEKGRRRRVK